MSLGLADFGGYDFGGFALAGLAGGSMGLNFASEVQAEALECMSDGDSMYMGEEECEGCAVRSVRATKSMAPPRRGKASAARVSRGSQVRRRMKTCIK